MILFYSDVHVRVGQYISLEQKKFVIVPTPLRTHRLTMHVSVKTDRELMHSETSVHEFGG